MTIKEKVGHYVFLSIYLLTMYSMTLIMFPLLVLKKIGFSTGLYLQTIFNDMEFMITYLITSFTATKVYFYFDKNIKREELYSKKVFDSQYIKLATIANHVSEIDPLFLSMYEDEFLDDSTKTVSFAKAPIRWYPVIGWILMGIDTIFVQNHNKSQDKNQHIYIEQKVKRQHKLYNSYNFNIFLEGTTFKKEIQDYRNQLEKRESGKIPEFKNIMVPRTQGLWLIENSVPIDAEYRLGINYLLPPNMKDNEEGILQLGLGRMPFEVHIKIDKREPTYKLVDETKLMDETGRESFNEQVVDRFKELDDILGDFNEWKNKYQHFQISRSFFNKKMLRLMIMNFFGLSLPFINFNFFVVYLLSMVSFNIFSAIIEF